MTTGRHASRRRRRWIAIVLAVLAVLVLLLVADAAWAAWTTRSALVEARDDLRCGADALVEADLAAADACFRSAADSADRASGFGRHPSVRAARLLPWIGDDVGSIDAITRAAADTAAGGHSLTAAARAAGWGEQGASLIGAGGTVDLAAIERAQPDLEAAAAAMLDASAEVDGIDPDRLVAPLEPLVADAQAELRRQADLVVSARDVGRVLPPMLGADAPVRYLLAFQNLSAPHGTGGYLGFLGELSATDGRLSLDSLDPVGDVPEVPPVEVPPDVERRYGRFGVATTMWASNYPPDVAESSRIATEIWKAAGRRPVDGVVWTDTVWMADVLEAIGPVDSAAWPEPVTADTVVDVFNRRLFESTDSAAIDRTQALLGLDLWRAVLTRQPDPVAFARAVSHGARTGHLALFTEDASTQATLQDLGAAGWFDLGANPLVMVRQDASANRAGFFAEHTLNAAVALDADGAATGDVEVTFRNRAPDGPPSILLGDGKGTPVGWWGVDVEVYLPAEAEAIRVRTSEPSVTGVDEAYGHRVADAFLFADPGGRSSATVSYRSAGAATEADGTWTYATQVRPQPSLRPIEHTLAITLPRGAEVIDAPDGSFVDGRLVTWTGAPTEPVELVVRYSL